MHRAEALPRHEGSEEPLHREDALPLHRAQALPRHPRRTRNITGRFVAPVENPFKICAPPQCDATPWSLCAPPGSPESQSLALLRSKFWWKPWSTRLHTPGFRVCLMAPIDLKPTSFGVFCTGHSFAGTRRRQCRPFPSLRFSILDGSMTR